MYQLVVLHHFCMLTWTMTQELPEGFQKSAQKSNLFFIWRFSATLQAFILAKE